MNSSHSFLLLPLILWSIAIWRSNSRRLGQLKCPMPHKIQFICESTGIFLSREIFILVPCRILIFFFFLCMCIYLYTFTHTESFSDFHSLLGDLHLLRGSTSSLEVLIPDLNQGRENAKYYIPENRVVVLFWLWQTVIKMLISVCFNKIS